MEKGRLEFKVGLFFAIGLILLVGLIVKFSKGSPLFSRTYQLRMQAANVGGIIPGAVVVMAGVPVGYVISTDLDETGRSVLIVLEIQERYRIHSDARFMIKQAGFLGDRYISVVPTENKGPILRHKDIVHLTDMPFDFEEAAKSATSLLDQIEAVATKLNEAVTRVDRDLINQETLTNLTVTFANLRVGSDRALGTLEEIDDFIRTSSEPIAVSVSNLVQFSEELNHFAHEIRETLSTNRHELTAAIHHLGAASKRVDNIFGGLERGEGVAGSLLKSDQLKIDVENTLSHVSSLASNLNKFGLLYKPKVRRTNTVRYPYPGRDPFK